MKATKQYVPVVLFIMLHKMVLTFESVDEILKCDQSASISIILRLSVEYATREVSRPSFTVKTALLSRATKQVSIGNIVFYWRHLK